LEQCSGQTSLFACADDGSCAALLPSLSSYEYFADSHVFCTRTATKQRDQCRDSLNGRVRLSLPGRVGSYFVMANGSGAFNFQVRGARRGVDLAPALLPAGGLRDNADDLRPRLQALRGNSAALTLRAARVFVPGLDRLQSADELRVQAVVVDLDRLAALQGRRQEQDFVRSLQTASAACAVELATQGLPDAALSLRTLHFTAFSAGDDSNNNDFASVQVTGLETSTCLSLFLSLSYTL
jgi:hypothetical protein